MPAQIPMGKIARSALKGIIRAQKEYEKWSGGEWLWCAPEYFSTVFVAQEIAKLEGSKYVTVENGAKSAIDDAGAMGRGRLHGKIRANGRFDILLWWAADETPRAPIEVKCQVAGIGKIKTDLQRIEKVLHRNNAASSFQFGMVVFYTSCRDGKGISAQDKLAKRIEGIKSDCGQLLQGCTVRMASSRIYTDGDSAWAASAIILKPIANPNK